MVHNAFILKGYDHTQREPIPHGVGRYRSVRADLSMQCVKTGTHVTQRCIRSLPPCLRGYRSVARASLSTVPRERDLCLDCLIGLGGPPIGCLVCTGRPPIACLGGSLEEAPSGCLHRLGRTRLPSLPVLPRRLDRAPVTRLGPPSLVVAVCCSLVSAVRSVLFQVPGS